MLQLREALEESSRDSEKAAQAHEEQLAAMRAQLQSLQAKFPVSPFFSCNSTSLTSHPNALHACSGCVHEVAEALMQVCLPQDAASQAQAELRAERAKLERLQEEAALARQGLTDLEAALQQERSQHKAATCQVIRALSASLSHLVHILPMPLVPTPCLGSGRSSRDPVASR